jgi:hypothetical protein
MEKKSWIPISCLETLKERHSFQIEEEPFQLTIIDLAHEGLQYTLSFSANKRVADVKRVTTIVTAVPLFRQSSTAVFSFNICLYLVSAFTKIFY